MNKKIQKHFRFAFLGLLTFLLVFIAGMGTASAADQEIDLLPAAADQPVGSSFPVTVRYDVSDGDNTLTSIGARIHFDSSKLTYNGFSDLFETGSLADPQLQDDAENNDGNDATDKLINISYSIPFGGNWPGVAIPLELVKLNFTAQSLAEPASTTLNVTQVTGHTGYGFIGTGATVNITVPPGTINGTIIFDEYTQGTILVGAFSDSGYENLVEAIDPLLTEPGSYTIDIAPGDYYIGAFNDVDSGGGTEPVDTDPRGAHDGVVTVASGGTINNINVIIDPGPNVTELSNDVTPTQSKTWTWGSDQPNCLFRYLIDQNLAGVPTETFGSVTTVTQSSGTGTYYLHVQAENDSTGICSQVTTVSALLDNTAPSAPSLNKVTTPTNVTPQPISGTKSANSSVLLGGTVIVSLDALTTWSYNLALSEGDNDFNLTSKDEAGNESGAKVGSIELDTTAPKNPSLDAFTNPTNITPQNISGTKETYSSVWLNGVEIVSLDDTNTWNYGMTLIEGVNNISLTLKDAAGNESGATSGSIVLDTTAPSAPGLDAVTTPTNVTPQTISGAKDADSSIWLNGEEIVSLPDVDITWEYSLALTEGTNNLSLTSKDALGNESGATTGAIVLDTVRPTVAIDGLYAPTDLTTQTVTGTREAGATISATDNTAALIGTVSYSTDTTWSFDVTGLVKDNNVITVTAQDAAGNTETAETTIVYHPPFAVSPNGNVYVPVTVPGYTQSFSITGGSGTFTWELNITTSGTLATASGTSNTFTPVQNTPGDAVLTITDTVYSEKSPILINIHAVTFGLIPSEGGIVLGDTLNLQVVGASGQVQWTVNTLATGSLGSFSGDNNKNAVFTGNAVGTTTITVTDGGTGAIVISGTFEVVNPIAVTAAHLAVADDDTLQFNVTGGTGDGDETKYDLAVVVVLGPVGSIAANGLFTPATGGGVRTFTVTATDQTYTTISGESVTVTVVDPIEVTPSAPSVQASDTMHVDVSGGTGTIIWSVEPSTAGSMDGDSLFTAAAVTENVPAVITATDTNYSNLTGSAAITVYSKVTITNKPEGTPIIQPGEDSEEFSVAGGDDSTYTWSVAGPDEYSGDGEGIAYTFTAPSEGTFAGEYTITVTDGQEFTDSFSVLVPMMLDPDHYTLLEGEQIEIDILGASDGTDFTFAAYDLSDSEIVFGEGTGWGQMTLDGNVLTYIADDIETTDEIAFTLEVTADDTDLADLGLDLIESGIYRVIPFGVYNGRIVETVDFVITPVEDARVEVVAPRPEPVVVTVSSKLPLFVDPYSQYTAADGIFEFDLPDTGAIYQFIVSKDDYVSKVFTSADLEENTDVSISLVADGMNISGMVTLETLPVESSVWLINSDGDIIGFYETEADGLFEFDFAEDSDEEYTLTADREIVGGELYGEATASIGDDSVTIDLAITITANDGVEYEPNEYIFGSDFLCQITAEDGSGPVTDFPNGLIVTMDFDLDKVTPGEFKAGVAVIYHAADKAELLAGNGTIVQVEDIIAVDYIGDGQTGYVTFRVYSLSIFGIGSPSPSPSSGSVSVGSDDGGGCFIATAAYGSLFEPHVEILRQFRDVYLLPTGLGSAFVDAYYMYSPPIADFIAVHDTLCAVVRVGLVPAVGMSYVALHTTPAQKVLLIVLMLGLLAGGFVAIRRFKMTRTA